MPDSGYTKNAIIKNKIIPMKWGNAAKKASTCCLPKKFLLFFLGMAHNNGGDFSSR